MDLKIRKATPQDLDRITAIEKVCFPEAEAASRESLKERLDVYHDSFLVAETEGEMVGFINGSVINENIIRDEFYSDVSSHDPKGDYQSIFGVDVLPEYRRNGIAAQLINAFMETAKKAGRKGMTLCSKQEKVHYYEKFGFVNIGKSESEHGNAVWYDMVLMF
jgi:ribosomal protein S18 acetylase RimI-like enzyme